LQVRQKPSPMCIEGIAELGPIYMLNAVQNLDA
jgi:hypothetical protein